MKRFLIAVAAMAMLVVATDSASAQVYYGASYGYGPATAYYGGPVYGSPAYGGGWYGENYYPGGYGVQTFRYDATLPGGGFYGYSYSRPGYYAAYRSPVYGLSYSYPGYYYRPGYYVWFND